MVARQGVAVQAYRSYVNTVSRPHRVNLLLISFIVRGRALHVMSDAEFTAEAGSVGITRYGESHDIVTDKRGIDIYNIYLDPRHFPVPLAPVGLRHIQSIIFPEHDRFRHFLNRSIHFQVRDPRTLLGVVQGIERETDEAGVGSADMVKALFSMLVITCCRAALESGIEPGMARDQAVPRWVLELCRYLDESYSRPVTLDDLSTRTGLSRSYLCRAFKRHVGLTAGDYLVQRRIAAAMQALRGTDEKILTISMECGFSDLSHFNRTFKQRVGTSPSAYRRNGIEAPPGGRINGRQNRRS